MTMSTDASTRALSIAAAIAQPLAGGDARVRGKPVETALRRELKVLARADAALAKSSLAMSALALAREIDREDNSATAKSMCAKAMREAWDRLRELTPANEGGDAIDDLAARRSTRIAS